MERNFIITGGARGFGKEFSKRVLEAGGRVVIADKNVEVGQETFKEFREVSSLNFNFRHNLQCDRNLDPLLVCSKRLM